MSEVTIYLPRAPYGGEDGEIAGEIQREEETQEIERRWREIAVGI